MHQQSWLWVNEYLSEALVLCDVCGPGWGSDEMWNRGMSHCHVRSHLSLMSALRRQQVGLSPAAHQHPVLLKHADRPCGWGVSCPPLIRQKMRCQKSGRRFVTSLPLRWRHPSGSWAGWKMTSLHPNQFAEEVIRIGASVCSGAKCLPRRDLWDSSPVRAHLDL